MYDRLDKVSAFGELLISRDLPLPGPRSTLSDAGVQILVDKYKGCHEGLQHCNRYGSGDFLPHFLNYESAWGTDRRSGARRGRGAAPDDGLHGRMPLFVHSPTEEVKDSQRVPDNRGVRRDKGGDRREVGGKCGEEREKRAFFFFF